MPIQCYEYQRLFSKMCPEFMVYNHSNHIYSGRDVSVRSVDIGKLEEGNTYALGYKCQGVFGMLKSKATIIKKQSVV